MSHLQAVPRNADLGGRQAFCLQQCFKQTSYNQRAAKFVSTTSLLLSPSQCHITCINCIDLSAVNMCELYMIQHMCVQTNITYLSYSIPMAFLVLTDNSQLTSDSQQLACTRSRQPGKLERGSRGNKGEELYIPVEDTTSFVLTESLSHVRRLPLVLSATWSSPQISVVAAENY
uniref:Uncharacterized protein n=1 Tax=Timema genevievae TaxID=629358 RepID=A0A7R9PIJ4_TIMGE|nr:unnamed protein product [Timema genevievae]